MDWNNLREFGKVIRESGAFSRVVERVQTTRLGPQDPEDGEFDPLYLQIFISILFRGR